MTAPIVTTSLSPSLLLPKSIAKSSTCSQKTERWREDHAVVHITSQVGGLSRIAMLPFMSRLHNRYQASSELQEGL
jgi:hypothetical protein